MDTAPLPAIPAGADGPPGRARLARATGPLRALEAVAGLASAGLVVLGAGLVVLQLISPDIAPGTGLAAAAGPTWWRALAHLGVGAAGELVVWARPRMSRGPRAWLSVAVLAATTAVLWWCWWR